MAKFTCIAIPIAVVTTAQKWLSNIKTKSVASASLSAFLLFCGQPSPADTINQHPQPSSLWQAQSIGLSGLPLTAIVPSPEGGYTELSLPNCWGYVWMAFKLRGDAEGDGIVEHLNFNELVVQRHWIIDSGMSENDWIAGRDGGGLIAVNQFGNNYVSTRETLENCVNFVAAHMGYASTH